MKNFASAILLSFFFFLIQPCSGQRNQTHDPVYVDSKGVLRWTATNKEAAFFGVNYTIPFAYGYRSHKALGVDIEKAIDADVYHMARLGLDAFRVHVWDTEISDSLGNLLENEHLRLFDYLLSKLAERNIKIIITPIAYWGNGYPERDDHTAGFSSIYNKQQALVNEKAILAQENYMRQFLHHINSYTKNTYQADPSVLALEINNEPHHSGPKDKTTEYINRMVAAVRGTGWSKPIFYNISESSSYADAIAKSNVNGFSFQWYPTGLVANRMQQGNFLPNVDHYKIPFGDTIPQFSGKARMVYEFDAADILQSDMYPAIARSFREAGFQWATQFAYDPLYTAYANTEYQTHYLNLAYTPGKAISLLIASKAFHELPRSQTYGSYPGDTLFGNFRVSYKEGLSEMNSDTAFYYSNNTSTTPKNIKALKHIAGVGSSPIIKYNGTGAYFLDKMANGEWRLEVMPDVVQLQDPFEKASPKKEVMRLQEDKNQLQISLPDITSNFLVTGLNDGTKFNWSPIQSSLLNMPSEAFLVKPGTYFIKCITSSYNTPSSLKSWSDEKIGVIRFPEFVKPPLQHNDIIAIHHPLFEVAESASFTINASFTGLDSSSQVKTEIRGPGRWQTLEMQRTNMSNYSMVVPSNLVTKGILSYRFIVQSNKETYVFPGKYKGDPYAWDSYGNETYDTRVSPSNEPLEIFNANTDRALNQYNPNFRNASFNYITTETPQQLELNITNRNKQLTGFQFYFGDKIKGRVSEMTSLDNLIIKARSSGPTTIHIALITKDAESFATNINIGNTFNEIKVPLENFQPDSMLLLPRPYPGFLPLYFKAKTEKRLAVEDVEKIEIIYNDVGSLEIETIWLDKNKK